MMGGIDFTIGTEEAWLVRRRTGTETDSQSSAPSLAEVLIPPCGR